MLKGVDVSNWQPSMTFKDYDFVIMKATEGVGYKDRLLDTHLSNALKEGKLIGFYHYARPETGNTPEEEAQAFLNVVKDYIGVAILALDWEGDALKCPVNWAKQWLDYIYNKTGVRPLLYIQGSQEWTGKYNAIEMANYGLWIAHWGVQKPDVRNWDIWALWQYTDLPLDTNYFNGNKEAWKAYARASKIAPTRPLQIGDEVRVLSRNDYNGIQNDSWVLDTTFTVLYKPEGDRVVIGKEGQITGAWNISSIERI